MYMEFCMKRFTSIVSQHGAARLSTGQNMWIICRPVAVERLRTCNRRSFSLFKSEQVDYLEVVVSLLCLTEKWRTAPSRAPPQFTHTMAFGQNQKEDSGKSFNPNQTLSSCPCSSLGSFSDHQKDFVSCLYEMAAKQHYPAPEFRDWRREGLSHDPIFWCTCVFKSVQVRTKGRTIKSAKQNAARLWLEINMHSERAIATIGPAYIGNVASKMWGLGKAVIGCDTAGEKDVKLKISRIALALAQLAPKMTPSSIGVFILQLAVEFGYSLDQLIVEVTQMFLSLAHCSTQLIQSIVNGIRELLLPLLVGSTVNTERAIPTIGWEDATPQVIAGAAGAIGGCVVLVATLITGVKDYSSQKGFLRHIAEFSSKISKMKGGLYALMDMIKHFHLFVKESVLAYLGEGTPATIVKAVESLNLQLDGKPLEAEAFFAMVEQLNTLEGESVMGVNPDALKHGELVLFVITKILTQNMTEKYAIPATAIHALADVKRSMEARVRSAKLKSGAREKKFEPFCIWVAGPSGAGKSTTVGFMEKWIHAALQKDPQKYELPSDDRFVFSANFTQEFHTGYNGQYIFAIDDMCQDQPGLLKNPSAMFLINAVSRVANNVTQAALEDKLCPFESKIVLCTSNITHPNRSKEIVEEKAFLRRRNLLIYAEAGEQFPEDPYLKRKIKFSLLDPLNEANAIANPIMRFVNFKKMMTYVIDKYIIHFHAQKALDKKVGNESDAAAFAADYWGFEPPVFIPDQHVDDVEEEEEDESPEQALPTMYRLPVNINPMEWIRKCKFAACRIGTQLAEIYETHLWKFAVGLSAAAVLALGAYAVYTWRNNQASVWENLDEAAEATYAKNMVRAKPPIAPSYNKELVRARAAQARALRSTFVEAMQIKNVVKVSRLMGSTKGSQNGLFVRDRFLLTCRHFFHGMKDGEEFVVTEYPQYSSPRDSQHSFDSRRMVRVPGAKDAVIYAVGFEVQCHKSIVNKFNVASLPERMDAVSIGVYPIQQQVVGEAKVLTRVVTYPISHEEDAEELQVEGFEMFIPTMSGRSGSILASDETVNRAPTIFGIQTSMMLEGRRAYFEALTRGQIEQALAAFEGEEATATMDYEADVPEEVKQMCQKSLIYVGPADRPVNQMQATRLQKSAIHYDIEQDKSLTRFIPSALSSRHAGPEFEGVDVLRKSMAGFDRQYGCVNMSLADEVLREFVLEDKSTRKHKVLMPRVLTTDETLNGIDGYGLKGVEIKTSPGLPLVHKKKDGVPGKGTWITMDDNQKRIMTESQWEVFREHDALVCKGEQPEYLAYACLKDELRAEDKVRALKTRSFIILPMIMNLLIRKYFGMWTAVQHGLHNTISSSVGIDVNTEWTDLKRRLLSKGEAIEDFDYTDWDRSLHAEWFRIYADRVSAWHGDRRGSPGWKARRTLMDILAHMPIQIGSHIVQTSGGNKSGCAITAEVNSDVHDMLMLYVWKRVCRNTGHDNISDIESFRSRVALALYGDDVVKASPPSVAKWFNGDAISVEVQKLGMRITPGNKVETEFRIKAIGEVTFLKRLFLELDEDSGLVRAPLDKAVIQRMMLWVHKSDEPLRACADNVKGALCEAFFWGEDFFVEMRERAFKAWGVMEAAGVHFPVVDYHVLRMNWMQKKRCDLMPCQFQFVSEQMTGEPGNGMK